MRLKRLRGTEGPPSRDWPRDNLTWGGLTMEGSEESRLTAERLSIGFKRLPSRVCRLLKTCWEFVFETVPELRLMLRPRGNGISNPLSMVMRGAKTTSVCATR